MSGQIPLLLRVNYLVKLPGYGEPFTSQQMRFDPTQQRLLIKTPEGITPFTTEDTLEVTILDLEVPAILRQQMTDNGWFPMPMNEFIHVINLTYLSES